MEVTGNFYDGIRTSKRHTPKTNAATGSQAESTETQISDSQMTKWASRIFTGLAILGWIVALVLVTDAIVFNSKLTQWTMVKL